MIIYIGVLYLILSSIYTFSFAGKIWNENKLASLGAILIVFLSMGVSLYVLLRSA